jgi:hypothetical protein
MKLAVRVEEAGATAGAPKAAAAAPSPATPGARAPAAGGPAAAAPPSSSAAPAAVQSLVGRLNTVADVLGLSHGVLLEATVLQIHPMTCM